MRGTKNTNSVRSGFLSRRRARQERGDAGRSYTFELAALHLQLLVAMAAVDEQIRSVEVEEVTAFIDRTTLPADDIARLDSVVRASINAPPQLQALVGDLAKLAKRPALANALVADLARVAAADARADEREVKLLEHVCTALNVAAPTIDIAEDEPVIGTGRPQTPPPTKRPPRLVTNHRVRTAVRTALEASYKSSDRPI